MKEGKSTIYGQFSGLVPILEHGGTSTIDVETKWYRYHPKVVPVPSQSGTSTTHQNRVGTGSSGTGTTAPCSPDFLYFDIFKPNFLHQ